MSQCIDCTHFTVADKKAREQGYGDCIIKYYQRTVTPKHEACELFQAETGPESITKRQSWLRGLHAVCK
jgi:hypothetical protein